MTTYRIKDIARINTDVLADSTDPAFEFKYIDIGAVDEHGNTQIPSEGTRFETAPSRARRLARPGDTIISTVRTYLRAIATVPQSEDNLVFSTGFAVLRASEQVDNRFLTYYCRSEPFINEVVARSVGVSYPAINPSDLATIDFPMRPLEEQRHIADFLDAETSRIDNLVSVKQKVMTLLDERRESLTSQLCLRGLRRTSPTRDSDISPIGAIPDHWIVTRNKNFIREVAELSETGDEELLTVSHITGVTPRSEKVVNMFMAESKVGYKICRPGDLVINTLWAWMGALGVTSHFGIVSPAYGVYRFTSNDIEPRYFDYLYRTREYICEMTRHSKGVWTSRLRLYPESFLALKCPVPPKAEQVEITRTLDRELESDQRLRSTIQRSCDLLAERRQALITAAVTGQFDVSTASGRGIED